MEGGKGRKGGKGTEGLMEGREERREGGGEERREGGASGLYLVPTLALFLPISLSLPNYLSPRPDPSPLLRYQPFPPPSALLHFR